MFSSVQLTARLPLQTSPYRTVATRLVIVALTAGFLWAANHDDQRCIELVLLALLAPLMLAHRDSVAQIIAIRPVSRNCIAAFFALGAAATLSAFSLRHAVYEWSILLLLAFTAALLAAEMTRAGAAGLRMLLRCLLIVGILHAVRIGLIYAAALASGVQIDMHALAAGFSNARFFNHTLTPLLPLMVLLTLQAPLRSAWRWVSFALAAFWWAFMFVSEARASLLGLGAGLTIALVLRGSHARDFAKLMALSALAGAAIYVLAFILLPLAFGLVPVGVPSNVLARTVADPSSGRTLLWALALQLIGAHPWLGVGPLHFAHEGHKLYIGAHPHDWLLQIGAEWGLPALLCLLGALASAARALLHTGKRIADDDLHNQQILVAFLTACAAIMVDGVFSGVLVMPQSQLAIVLLAGCATGWVSSLDPTSASTSPSRPARYAVALAVAVGLCGLAWSVAPDFLRHAKGEEATPAEKAINNKGNWPRLWEAGYF